MCVLRYVCVHIRAHVCVHVHMYMCVCTSVYMSVHNYVCACIYLGTYVLSCEKTREQAQMSFLEACHLVYKIGSALVRVTITVMRYHDQSNWGGKGLFILHILSHILIR